jgi:hypothetical protein
MGQTSAKLIFSRDLDPPKRPNVFGASFRKPLRRMSCQLLGADRPAEFEAGRSELTGVAIEATKMGESGGKKIYF